MKMQISRKSRCAMACMALTLTLAAADRSLAAGQPGLRSTRGVGPGDPVSRVLKAYRGLEAEPRAYVENEQTLTHHAGPNAIRFETLELAGLTSSRTSPPPPPA
jgi:hypothetical protein